MNIRHLQYFSHVARLHNLNAAAHVSYVTPSTLSKAISELEAELDCRLFERHTRGMRLTSAGQILDERVQLLLFDIDRIRQEIRSLKTPDRAEETTAIFRLTPEALPITHCA
jgi:DNA-binding transcriptional LysR family regulator